MGKGMERDVFWLVIVLGVLLLAAMFIGDHMGFI
jgi:hypothetical protein